MGYISMNKKSLGTVMHGRVEGIKKTFGRIYPPMLGRAVIHPCHIIGVNIISLLSSSFQSPGAWQILVNSSSQIPTNDETEKN